MPASSGSRSSGSSCSRCPSPTVSWTIDHEEIFREARELCVQRSQNCRTLVQRKFFYIFTCEYCFSHYVVAFFLAVTGYRLLLDDWRGYLLSFFAVAGWPTSTSACSDACAWTSSRSASTSRSRKKRSGASSERPAQPRRDCARRWRAASAPAPDAARPSACCHASPAAPSTSCRSPRRAAVRAARVGATRGAQRATAR